MLPTHVLDPTFESLRRDFDTATAKAAKQARADLLQTLNQLFRRFRNYQSESDWVQATVDAAALFAHQVAVFGLENGTLHLRGQAPADGLPADLSFPMNSAAAFASAVDLKDLVTALRTAGEVSPALSDGHATERAHILPILNSGRVSALLFAADNACDMNALELIAGVASSVLERKANLALHAQILPAMELAAPPNAALSVAKLPAWGDMNAEQRQLHIRAQRFARVSIAEIQLARPEACRAGREQGDLYLFLKREIDRARENYRKQFMTLPAMVDYLHLELIQTAAEGDEQKLGAEYPGRLL